MLKGILYGRDTEWQARHPGFTVHLHLSFLTYDGITMAFLSQGVWVIRVYIQVTRCLTYIVRLNKWKLLLLFSCHWIVLSRKIYCIGRVTLIRLSNKCSVTFISTAVLNWKQWRGEGRRCSWLFQRLEMKMLSASHWRCFLALNVDVWVWCLVWLQSFCDHEGKTNRTTQVLT